jgi:hypothetical protein
MSPTKLSLGGKSQIIPAQGEFGKRHLGWRRECRLPFFQCMCRRGDHGQQGVPLQPCSCFVLICQVIFDSYICSKRFLPVYIDFLPSYRNFQTCSPLFFLVLSASHFFQLCTLLGGGLTITSNACIYKMCRRSL